MAGENWRDALYRRVSRSDVPSVDVSIIVLGKDRAEQNRRLKKMYAEISMQNEVRCSRKPWEKSLEAVLCPSVHCAAMSREGHRRGMALKVVAMHGVSVALACRTFRISETCYRYSPTLSTEKEEIPHLSCTC